MNSLRGFTLMEIAIVLVLIGLLVGGILAGQSLIRAAELRSITKRLESYQTAAMTFQNKYNGLPGDIPNATNFWDVASGGCPNGTRTPPQTCNGNGDGMIGNNGNGNGFTHQWESFTFWQQLASAGMIEGTYTGYGPAYVLGTNAPLERKFTTAGYGIYHIGTNTDSGYYLHNYHNLFYFGNLISAGSTYPPITPVLTSQSMWNIDVKMDDGVPSNGRILSMKAAWNAGCTTSDVDASAAYTYTDAAPTCSILYVAGF